MSTRKEMLAAAEAILKANPEPKNPAVRIRYRGGRPAMNWLKKHDEKGAAALWLVARDRLPPEADNDNEPTKGKGIDRRKDGKPRGRDPDPRSLGAYLALPCDKPRLGDAPPEPIRRAGWDGESRGITIKPQRDVFDFHPNCRFGFCAPAIANGAIFLGAEGGLGQPKMGKQRGDVRRVDGPDLPKPPEEVDTVIETMLSGGNVADIGKALGARGGHADRRGGAALLAAGRWAKMALAA
jgi:hypothetical protein